MLYMFSISALLSYHTERTTCSGSGITNSGRGLLTSITREKPKETPIGNPSTEDPSSHTIICIFVDKN